MDPDVTVVIAAKNEAPTIGDVVTCCRRFAGQVLVVDGSSHDGTDGDCARERRRGPGRARPRQGRCACAWRFRTSAAASPCSSTPMARTIPTDIPRLVEPIRDGEADHVSASRLIGGSSELHGGFDEFFRLAGSSFITACINWRFGVRLSDSQNGFRAIRTCVLRDLGLGEGQTTIEQEMIIRDAAPRLSHGRGPEPRAGAPVRRVARHVLARGAAICLEPVHATCSGDRQHPGIGARIVNILGIWDGHDSGAALLVDGRLVAAVNEERLTRRKLEVGFPSASIASCLAMAALRPRRSTSSPCRRRPAKTLGRCARRPRSATTRFAAARRRQERCRASPGGRSTR